MVINKSHCERQDAIVVEQRCCQVVGSSCKLSICRPQTAVELSELICGVFRDHYSNPLGATRVY